MVECPISTIVCSLLLVRAAAGRRVSAVIPTALALLPWPIGVAGTIYGAQLMARLLLKAGLVGEAPQAAGLAESGLAAFIGNAAAALLLAAVALGLAFEAGCRSSAHRRVSGALIGFGCSAPLLLVLLCLPGPNPIGLPESVMLVCVLTMMAVATLSGAAVGAGTTAPRVTFLAAAAPTVATLAVVAAASHTHLWALNRVLEGIAMMGPGELDGALLDPLGMVAQTGRLRTIMVGLATLVTLVLAFRACRLATETLPVMVAVLVAIGFSVLAFQLGAEIPVNRFLSSRQEIYGPVESRPPRPAVVDEARPYRVLPKTASGAVGQGTMRAATYLRIGAVDLEVDGTRVELSELAPLINDPLRKNEHRPLLIHPAPEATAGRVASVLAAIEDPAVRFPWYASYLVPAAIDSQALSQDGPGPDYCGQLFEIESTEGRNRFRFQLPTLWIATLTGSGTPVATLATEAADSPDQILFPVGDRTDLADLAEAPMFRQDHGWTNFVIDTEADAPWEVVADLMAGPTSERVAFALAVEGMPCCFLNRPRAGAFDDGIPAPAAHADSAGQPPPPLRYVVGGAATEPVRISGEDPAQPEAAKQAGITGVVVLELTISSTGEVTNVKVVRRVPYGITEAAVTAAKTWIFEPATLDGEPIDIIYIMAVRVG